MSRLFFRFYLWVHVVSCAHCEDGNECSEGYYRRTRLRQAKWKAGTP